MTNPQLAAIVLVLAFTTGLGAGIGIDRQVMGAKIDRMKAATAEVDRQRAEIRAADELDARTKEQKLTARVGQVEQEKTNAINANNRRLAAELDRLRQRPDRRPAPGGEAAAAGTTCSGATGAELSRSDAGFLVGEAARADDQRAALQACYGAYDAVRDALK